MKESKNPFRYSEPVPPAELLDRDGEARALLERAVGGNNSRLVAPRRYQAWVSAAWKDQRRA